MTAKLDENIYVIQPIGFTDGTNWICKLNTTLNELKQSARVWKTKFVSILTNFGLVQNPVDQSIFTGQDIVVVAYVDDIIIFNKNVETVNKLKTHILKHIDIIDLNNAKFYLNMEIRVAASDRKSVGSPSV